jgi:hypothetical protein
MGQSHSQDIYQGLLQVVSMKARAIFVCCTALALSVGTAHGQSYPKELPDNAPGWFSRKDWLPPKPPDPKIILEDIKKCEEHPNLWCFLPWLQLLPKWLDQANHPLEPVAFQWPTPAPILVQWPELLPTVVRDDIGGMIVEYVAHWEDLAARGDEVDILGPCWSACTLVTAYIPKDQLCFGQDASLQFHAAWERETGKVSLWATKWMISKYPADIRRWLALRGPPESNTVQEWWILPASELWKMGYKRCHA